MQAEALPVGIFGRLLQQRLAIRRMPAARGDAGKILRHVLRAIAPVGLCADPMPRAVGQQFEHELAVVAVEDPHADSAVLHSQATRQVDDGRQA
ncbi:hypothetical protein D3C81_1964300 [compost metagenome]